MLKNRIEIDKPMYISQKVLDANKIVIYEFQCENVIRKWGKENLDLIKILGYRYLYDDMIGKCDKEKIQVC